MTDGSSAARKSYTVVFKSNVGELNDFLPCLRNAVEQTHACTEAVDWRGVGATMNITVAKTKVEVIACPVNEFSLGNIMLNIAEPFSFMKLLRKQDFKSVRFAAEQVSDGLVHCGIPSEAQFWAKSNPPDFDDVDDWMIGEVP